MAHYNNEPFIGTLQDQDFEAITREAGFDKDLVMESVQSHHRPKANESKTNAAYEFIAVFK